MKLFEKKTKIVPRNSEEKEALLEKLSKQGIDFQVKELSRNLTTGDSEIIIKVRESDLRKLA
ncbi:MAG: hypothetical protein J6Y75_04135 [Spirochaetaceae bacterium]|nr:hypothetical protein [Spirochaetaceae bacterium]MBP5329066.1 hypothetical protein [Spirochaetaceae bacterium]